MNVTYFGSVGRIRSIAGRWHTPGCNLSSPAFNGKSWLEDQRLITETLARRRQMHPKKFLLCQSRSVRAQNAWPRLPRCTRKPGGVCGEWKAVVPMMQWLWPFQGAWTVRPSYRGIFVERQPPHGGRAICKSELCEREGKKEPFASGLSEAVIEAPPLVWALITNEGKNPSSQNANWRIQRYFISFCT